jgi:ribosomal protein L29
MKSVEISKLRQLDDKKLAHERDLAHVFLHKLYAEKAMMTLKDTSKLAKAKKALAHIQTVVSERKQLAAYQAVSNTPEVPNDK